ncbi:hypothetical protein [Woeseia oceani]|uniref:Uncharacterized protein n=1 Tax=Woeseia oceani TaxID=1548547 RepID=A0A193LDS6_9GAMM|nr:hypothetical protein [Woeseia oceani]ANO50662.1 hypothetical protein BA177_05075 [Woeseia oceani]
MKTITLAALTAIGVFIAACNYKYMETQDIEITHYADDERNTKLAEDLMYYDPRFLAHQILALNEETSHGIQLGYFVRSSDNKPSYRITYNRSVDAVSENLEDLKSQFEAYIPQLAAKHASKESLFLELEPMGMKWAQDFFSQEAGTILENSSKLLRDFVTVAQLEEFQRELETEFGSPTKFEFTRAQFYEEHADVPDSISLFYETEMSDNSVLMFRVSLHETEQEWRALGFRFDKIR